MCWVSLDHAMHRNLEDVELGAEIPEREPMIRSKALVKGSQCP